MISNEEEVRAAIAEQAGEWFVAHEDGLLDTPDSVALAAWLKASPVHIEELLGVAVVARDLREAAADPEYSIDAVLARARAEDDSPVRPFWPRVIAAGSYLPSRRWLIAAATVAALGGLSIGVSLLWNMRPIAQVSDLGATKALHYETRHGEQLRRRLADNSVLHLDTDSAVTIRYSKMQRLITLSSGQADFEVAREPDRAFRVFAGSAEVVALGTKFDVRLDHDSTMVTVVEGRVAVGLSPMLEQRGNEQSHVSGFIQLGADQQIRVGGGVWPATPLAVDAQRTTAWLRREFVFDHEPLERVAAEFNRYAPKPIEISTPALRVLQISGVFATDHTEEFIAFLSSLKGVRVEVTATRILVSQD